MSIENIKHNNNIIENKEQNKENEENLAEALLNQLSEKLPEKQKINIFNSILKGMGEIKEKYNLKGALKTTIKLFNIASAATIINGCAPKNTSHYLKNQPNYKERLTHYNSTHIYTKDNPNRGADNYRSMIQRHYYNKSGEICKINGAHPSKERYTQIKKYPDGTTIDLVSGEYPNSYEHYEKNIGINAKIPLMNEDGIKISTTGSLGAIPKKEFREGEFYPVVIPMVGFEVEIKTGKNSKIKAILGNSVDELPGYGKLPVSIQKVPTITYEHKF